MRKFCVLMLFILVAGVSFANVIAVDISVNTSGALPQISYRLNEAATSVNIEIFGPLPATTHVRDLAGTTNKGLNTVGWDRQDDGGNGTDSGKTYGFKITPSDSVGHASWDLLSNDADTILQHYSPRGVAVNNNVASEYFGRVYVCNHYGGTCTEGGATRTTGKGVYILYPDGSDPTAQGDTAYDGSVSWSTGNNSPYQVSVGPDDNVYITDWSDSHSGLWRGGPDCSGSFIELLDSTGRDSSGLNSVHGSISACWVEGTGASTVVYVDDEDFVGGGTGDRTYSVWRHDIGTGPFPINAAPTVVIDDDVLLNQFVSDAGAGLIRDSSDNWYRTQYRYDGTDLGSVFQLNAAGTTIQWDSLVDGGTSPDPLRGAAGQCAIDEARNRLIVGISTGHGAPVSGFAVVPLPLPVGNLATQMTTVEWAGANTRGVDLDLAGNVYVVDNINERLRIYSPPDGANSYTTETNLTLPGGDAPLGASSSWSLYQ